MNAPKNQPAQVFSVFATRRGRTWVSAGVARLERDGSINVELDVLPIDGRLHLRPKSPALPAAGEVWCQRDEQAPGDLVIMFATPEGLEQLGRVKDFAKLKDDQIFNRLANAALSHRANLADPWLRLDVKETTK